MNMSATIQQPREKGVDGPERVEANEAPADGVEDTPHEYATIE